MSYMAIMESAQEYIAAEPRLIYQPQDVDRFIRPLIGDQEEMWVINLTTKNTIIDFRMVTRGLVDRAQAHAREIFRSAIIANACRIILVHNHPSGNTEPSAVDIKSTKQLVAAGEIVGIKILDHIIIGDGFTSMKERGLL